MRKPIDLDGFEAKFAADPDPWNYAASRFERYKRGILMRAVGLRIYGRGLELACANGETTPILARRCLRLLALDGSRTALEHATERNRGLPRIRFVHAVLPEAMPKGPFDLIVVSELLYYLRANDLVRLLHTLKKAIAPSGRIVFLHHQLGFDDTSTKPQNVTRRILGEFVTDFQPAYRHRDARFEAIAFDRHDTSNR